MRNVHFFFCSSEVTKHNLCSRKPRGSNLYTELRLLLRIVFFKFLGKCKLNNTESHATYKEVDKVDTFP